MNRVMLPHASYRGMTKPQRIAPLTFEIQNINKLSQNYFVKIEGEDSLLTREMKLM